MNEILSYYATHSPLTDPGAYTALYDDLPDTPDEITAVVRGLLVHKLGTGVHNFQPTSLQRAEQFLRTMQERLARINELDPAPLTVAREPKERQLCVCRDFALMTVSMLRHKGIPARMRVGFAEYLEPHTHLKIDHWLPEYWDEKLSRWVLIEPEADESWLTENNLFWALRYDVDFYLAGSAWQLCRAGKEKSLYFRFSGRWKGMPCIRGNMLHDFQSLNKLELSVLDHWDELSQKSESALTVEDKTLLDRIAGLTLNPDENFEEMRALFDDLPRTKTITSRLRLLGVISDGERASPESLLPSGIQQLTTLGVLGTPTESPTSSRGEYIPYDVPPDSPLGQMHMAQWMTAPGIGDIVIRGARQHNLKHIDVHIPRHKLVVVTGVSGSGKSSLAFDTIYAEGQRRYVESLSSFARQFMGQIEKPQVDQITGLSPAIAIEQKTISRNPRSTVGTVTEILDYLRVLYARIGVPHCPQCGRAVQPQSAQQITNQLGELPEGTRFQLLAPIVRNRKGTHKNTLRTALKEGFTRARVDGEVIDLTVPGELPALDKKKKHNIELIVDRLITPNGSPDDDYRTRLMDSVETSLRAADGVLLVNLGEEEITLSEHNACPVCDVSFPELEPNMFSFNSPFGMCPECNGLGIKLQVDPDLIITQPHLSLLDGASAWYGNLRKKGKRWITGHLKSMADHYQTDLETPWNQLPEEFRHALMYGSGEVKFRTRYESEDGSWSGQSLREAKGNIFHVNRLFRQTKSEWSRRYYMQFMSKLPCPTCEGERLCPEARFVTVGGKRLPELASFSIEAIHEWISTLSAKLDPEQRQIGDELITEVLQRLGFIRNVGLHYLTLDRSAPTLSGGEGQRIRLASQIGSGLVGVLYILDEPSIGLHIRDHRALLDTLIRLRDIGNTLLVVEHDAETMRTADWLIDLGPGPGTLGGEVVATGSPEEVMMNPDSLTGQYLSNKLNVTAPNGRKRRPPLGGLTLNEARLHNLKNITISFPLGTLICVTGVSGSGKSSLIAQTLHPTLSRILHNAQRVPGPNGGIEGLDQVNKVINITQDPIGRNPRSNPGTYVGVLSEIRKVFTLTPEAKSRGYKAGRFSFNVKGGRCEACAGYGYKKVEMHFLADVWVKCKECGGKRFNRQTLAIAYKGKNIADVLDMDVQEALTFFANHPKIKRILQTLHDVGLDYVKLGQSALTLSGGEAQRVKLSKELSRLATGKTIYFLDEPTTGLHFADIQRLLDVLHRLVDSGNTVIIIEHNLDVIKTADWIIDLGPEGGEKGGYVVAEGTPEDVSKIGESYTGRFLRNIIGIKEPSP
jgi:excinuclease ABC subunit A